MESLGVMKKSGVLRVPQSPTKMNASQSRDSLKFESGCHGPAATPPVRTELPSFTKLFEDVKQPLTQDKDGHFWFSVNGKVVKDDSIISVFDDQTARSEYYADVLEPHFQVVYPPKT